MKNMISLDREWEDEIKGSNEFGRREYDAVWEVYNSQPLYGGSIKSTIKLIDRALEITESPALIQWLNEYKAAVSAHL